MTIRNDNFINISFNIDTYIYIQMQVNTQYSTKMEEEEDFDETNHRLTKLIINLCFKSILKARDEESNVKSLNNNPHLTSPIQLVFNRGGKSSHSTKHRISSQ